jgi:hypothetical protein
MRTFLWHTRCTHGNSSALLPQTLQGDAILHHRKRRVTLDLLVGGTMLAPDALTFLQAQLTELNQYSRIELQIYVTWFTFFITVILTAMAWAIKTSLDEEWRVRFPLPVYMIYLLFAFQIVMGALATRYVEKDLEISKRRIEAIQKQLLPPALPSFYQKAASTLPRGFITCVHLMEWTLWSHLVFWGCVTVMIWYLARKASRADGLGGVRLHLPRAIDVMPPNAPIADKRVAKSETTRTTARGKTLHPMAK